MHETERDVRRARASKLRYAIWVLYMTSRGKLATGKVYANSLNAGLAAFDHKALIMDDKALAYIIRRTQSNDTLDPGHREWTPVPSVRSIEVIVTPQLEAPPEGIHVSVQP